MDDSVSFGVEARVCDFSCECEQIPSFSNSFKCMLAPPSLTANGLAVAMAALIDSPAERRRYNSLRK